MKQTAKNILLSISLALTSVFMAAVPQIASADTAAGSTGVNVFSNCGAVGTSGATSGSQICGAQSPNDFTKIITNIINTLLFALGIIAVIMIIFGGIRYTTSNGDAGQVKSAKDTVLYAVVGLVVAILAFAIVNFVIASLKK